MSHYKTYTNDKETVKVRFALERNILLNRVMNPSNRPRITIKVFKRKRGILKEVNDILSVEIQGDSDIIILHDYIYASAITVELHGHYIPNQEPLRSKLNQRLPVVNERLNEKIKSLRG